MSNFIHLHTHSENSFFDGLPKVKDILKKCQTEQMKAVAITDHHNIFSWFQLNKWAKEYGIIPIYGIELNIDKHHMTALAFNDQGLVNLCRLNNIGYQKKNGTKVTEKELEKHHEGIYFLSGCTKGKIPSLIWKGAYEEAYQCAKHYQDLFYNRFFIELQSYQLLKNKFYAKQLVHLSKELKIPIIPTNDCHYLNKEEAKHYQQLVAMHTNGKSKPTNEENYFKRETEMEQLYPERVLQNSTAILSRLNVHFEKIFQPKNEGKKVPLSMMYYYDDAESIKKALYSKKKYALAEFLYKKIKKERLTLEQLPVHPDIANEIEFAYVLRNRLYKVEPDPYYYIMVDDHFPLWRKSKEKEICAQIDIFTAKELGFTVYDQRKTALVSR